MAASDFGNLSACQGQNHFTIPRGLKCLLEEMSREVLKHQPGNIYLFLANHLEDKCRKQDCGGNCNPAIGVGPGGTGDLRGLESRTGTTDPGSLPPPQLQPNSLAPFGLSPEGDPIPGPNLNAPYGYGPDGKALEKLDPSAPYGYGPDGRPLPGAACVSPYGFGPDGFPLAAADSNAPFGYHLSDGLPVATNDPTAPFGYGRDGEPLKARDPNAPFGYDESGTPNTAPELVSFCSENELFSGGLNSAAGGMGSNNPMGGSGPNGAGNYGSNPGGLNGTAGILANGSLGQNMANLTPSQQAVQAQKMAELARLTEMKDEICGVDPDGAECADAQNQVDSAAASVNQSLQAGDGCGESGSEGGIMYFGSGGANVLVSLDPRCVCLPQPTCSPMMTNNPGMEVIGGQRGSNDCGGGAMRNAMQSMLTRVMSIMSNILGQAGKCSSGPLDGNQNLGPGMGRSTGPAKDAPTQTSMDEGIQSSRTPAGKSRDVPAQDLDAQVRAQAPQLPPRNPIPDPLLDIPENTGTTGDTIATMDGVGPEGAGDMCGLDTAGADCTPQLNNPVEEDMQAGTVGEADDRDPSSGLQIPSITVISPSIPDVRLAPDADPSTQDPTTGDVPPPEQVASKAASAQSPPKGPSTAASAQLDQEVVPEGVSDAPPEQVPSKAASVRSPSKGPSTAPSTQFVGAAAAEADQTPEQQGQSNAAPVPTPPKGPSTAPSTQSFKDAAAASQSASELPQQEPKDIASAEPQSAVSDQTQQPAAPETGIPNPGAPAAITTGNVSSGKPGPPRRRQRCIPPELKQYVPIAGGGVCELAGSANAAAARAAALAKAGKCAPPVPPRLSALNNLQITRTSAQGKMGDYIEDILHRASGIIMATRQQCGGATPPVFHRPPAPDNCEDLDALQQQGDMTTGTSSSAAAEGQTGPPICGPGDEPLGVGSIGKYLKEIAPQYQEMFADVLSPEDQTTLTLLTTVGTLLDTIEDTGLTRMDPIQLCSDKTLSNLVDVGERMLVGLKEHLAKVNSSPQELPTDPFMAQITREAYDALNIGAESLEVAVGLLKDVTSLCGELAEHPELMEKCAADLDEARKRNEGQMKEIGEKQVEACKAAKDEKSILDKELEGPDGECENAATKDGDQDSPVTGQDEATAAAGPGNGKTGKDEATGDTVQTHDQGADAKAAAAAQETGTGNFSANVQDTGVEAAGQPAKDFGNRGVEPGSSYDGLNPDNDPNTGTAALSLAPGGPGGKTGSSKEESSNWASSSSSGPGGRGVGIGSSPTQQQLAKSQGISPSSNQLSLSQTGGGGRIVFITVSFIVGMAVGYVFARTFGLFGSGRGVFWGTGGGLSCAAPPGTPPLPVLPPEPHSLCPRSACGKH